MIDYAAVSFSLGYNKGTETQSESYMIIGGIDHDQYVGTLLEFPLLTD